MNEECLLSILMLHLSAIHQFLRVTIEHWCRTISNDENIKLNFCFFLRLLNASVLNYKLPFYHVHSFFVTDEVIEYLSKLLLLEAFQFSIQKKCVYQVAHILLVIWLLRNSFTLTETLNKIQVFLCFQGVRISIHSNSKKKT
jgi:hypothetical protein